MNNPNPEQFLIKELKSFKTPDTHLFCDANNFSVDEKNLSRILKLYFEFLTSFKGRLLLVLRDQDVQTVSYLHAIACLLHTYRGVHEDPRFDMTRFPKAVSDVLSPARLGVDERYSIHTHDMVGSVREVSEYLDSRISLHQEPKEALPDPVNFFQITSLQQGMVIEDRQYVGLRNGVTPVSGESGDVVVDRFKFIGKGYESVSFLDEDFISRMNMRLLENGVVFSS